MLAVVNHFYPYYADLSVRVAGVFVSARMLPAQENTATCTTRPAHCFLSQPHVDALRALDVSDPSRLALGGFELVDMGSPTTAGQFEASAQAALATALQPRPINIINNVRVRS